MPLWHIFRRLDQEFQPRLGTGKLPDIQAVPCQSRPEGVDLRLCYSHLSFSLCLPDEFVADSEAFGFVVRHPEHLQDANCPFGSLEEVGLS